MTSASELFHNRRSRIGRSSNELGLDSYLDRNFHHNHHNRRHNSSSSSTRRDRHDPDGCDPLRRPFQSAYPSHRPSFSEREPVRQHQGNILAASGNGVYSGNDRLPGRVLLARERLLERLRGASASGNRQRSRVSSRVNDQELPSMTHNEVEDWVWLAGAAPSTDYYPQTDSFLVLEETSKRPPGLSHKALDSLTVEIFSEDDKGEQTITRSPQECSICLENFVDGDQLIRLPCSHRFHSCCLNPWVQRCGDCPYCRTGIIVTSLEP